LELERRRRCRRFIQCLGAPTPRCRRETAGRDAETFVIWTRRAGPIADGSRYGLAEPEARRRIRRITAAIPAVRGVLTTGKGVDPTAISAADNVQVLRSAPHGQVLRESAAVVTHCGHGTTIKALAAGLPLVCMPMGRDQLDVAARVVHRGAGVRLEPSAPPAEIGGALRTVLDQPDYRRAAEGIAAIIAEETAEDRAVVELEALVAGGVSSRALT